MVEEVEIDPQQHFEDFLKSEKNRERISQMRIESKTSLVLDFDDLLVFNIELAENLKEAPDEYLNYVNRAAYSQLEIEDSDYASKIESVTARFKNLPTSTHLRMLGAANISKLIMVEGIIVRATPVQPQVMRAAFKCKRCGETVYLDQVGPFLRAPLKCEVPHCQGKGPFEFVQKGSTFIDFQEIRIQERPEDLPPGQLPRTLNVKLVSRDLVDKARPGDHVRIVGIIRAEAPVFPTAGKLRVFRLHVDANYLDVESKEPETGFVSPQEEERVKQIAEDPWVHRNVMRSMAPSIYGYEAIKEAIMYLIFGGVPKHLADISVRGELNILLVGDPGTAKSQLLQYVSAIAPRGLYTSGRGTTAAGLTAAVLREQRGGMTLEAGALVLADKGVACIDEIDKMKPEDRVAIHEAMEQHTVSVAKGGIVATLNARTAILAAANPSLGRYDAYKTVSENINLPITILSRFDLIFVLKDVPEKDLDEKMSTHILELHKTGSAPVETPIQSDMLRKYISYAKNIKPVLTDGALNRLKEFYLEMRAVTEKVEGSPIAITARQLESLVRLAEARARIALRKEVIVEDAEAAIVIMNKSLEEVGIDVSTNVRDIDVIMVGKPKSMQDKLRVILSEIIELSKETGMVERNLLVETVTDKYKFDAIETQRLIGRMVRDGTIYEPRPGFLKKV
ncbi:MAG: minichromosome maintenance protein MCM [Candidatus Bathyarchaeota archaeon]|jgi:replicative DNA helicase Mcm|nr:MAG: minichromosome maintenance protein MCM [Candidatus Bathyarchaeota archaeon]